MRFADYYEINVVINNRTLDSLPTQYSFSMHDSIYQIFNWGMFVIKDSSSVFQEGFASIEGLDFRLEYGTDEVINSCDYVVQSDNLSRSETKGLLNGEVTVNLVNKWYDSQEIKSKAYRNRISTIVQNLAGNYFKNLDITTTGARDTWYQPLMTDARFINDMLLPISFFLLYHF